MINPQWLELPMSRTNFHGSKDIRAIEVRLYFKVLEYLSYIYIKVLENMQAMTVWGTSGGSESMSNHHRMCDKAQSCWVLRNHWGYLRIDKISVAVSTNHIIRIFRDKSY